MNKYYKKLELDKILELLAEQTYSDACREKALKLKPSFDEEEIRTELKKTDDAFKLSAKFGTPRFRKIKDLSMSLRRCKSGSALSFRELLDVADILRETNMLCDWFSQCESMESSLAEYFRELYPIKQLEQRISESIISEEEMSDAASAELSSIRKRIVRQGMNIREQLDKLIKSRSTQKFLQEAIVTMRDGRYVVPVRSEYKNEVAGLVHDTSATGQTFFIEPMSVVEANNEIRVLKSREQAEIERITLELSGQVGENADSIANNFRIAQILELYFAKANLGAKMRGAAAKIVSEPRVVLNQARHPLINPDTVVPISVEIGGKYESLIITGPNTGGKTVTLKTAGLLCAMAQCGFLIPADERSEICVFDEFLVDIGDEQSIEQSLSTFSGHMKKITGILELAMPHTLVLLDELGAGTDPAEGAALAVAIIEELRRRGVLLMATTHYAELKVFALETKGVVNASCEFDLETLRPTYKLSVGVPGKSNAFLISEKLGIPERVIEAAQQHLSAEDKRLDAVLGQLDDLKLQLKASQDEVEGLKNEAAHQLDAARQKRDELIQQGENELEAARAKARALAQEVESKAYALTDELRQIQKDERMSTQQKAQRAREIAKKESEKLFMGTEVVHNPVKEFVSLKEVKVGQEVCIAELNQLATVLSLPDKNGDVLVRAGIIKTKVPLKGLKQPEKLVKETKPQTKAQQRYSRLTGDANRPNGRVERVQRTAKMECNLLGLTVDEALPEVDSFIDRAILNGQTVVYLIHGNGTGALRTAIHKHLRGNRMVKSFRLGRYGEGESGVTVVELK